MVVEVRYLPPAQQDLLDTVDWIAENSPEKARAWVSDMDARVEALSALPESGRKPRSRRLQTLGYRVLVLGDYLVFYQFSKKEILVHRVLHRSRNLNSIV